MGGYMSTISASTTSTTAYKVTADTTGALVLQTGATPTTAMTIGTDQNVTLAKGLIVGATAAPAFSAYLASNQTPSNATYTKVQINTVTFDTASCFNTSTYRFTPTVAGYYQIQAASRLSGTTPTTYVWAIYKNGSGINELNVTSTITYEAREISTLLSMNGTTDYVEFYCYINAASAQTFNSGINTTWFQGFLARSA